MGIKDKVESDPLWWCLGLVVASFLAGLGAYQTGMSIFGLQALPKGSVSRSDLAENYLSKRDVAENYYSKDCAQAPGYPRGSWLISEVTLENAASPVFNKQIVFSDAKGGTWFEGLGKPNHGSYLHVLEAPFTVSSELSPGKTLDITMTHANFPPEVLPFITPEDRDYHSTGRATVSPDGCWMTSMTSEPTHVGTVQYCWQPAFHNGQCSTLNESRGSAKP